MKLTYTTVALLAATALAAPMEIEKRHTVKGFNISHYQGTVDFKGAYNSGMRFFYIKATEATTYKDSLFSEYYIGATKAGFVRGGYHFAHGKSDATAQADYFLAHGGDWSMDAITLPGMLDLEGDCTSVSWIKTFSNRYHSKTGRYPVLYTSP